MALDDLKEFLGVSASICQIIQFFSGMLICRKFMKKGSSDDTSVFPFLFGFLSCSLWTGYSRLLNDVILIYINVLGSLLMFSYISAYYVCTKRKGRLLKQILFIILVIVVVQVHTKTQIDIDKTKSHLGMICSIVSLFFYAAPLANLRHVMKAKSSESLPFPIIITTTLVSFQWFLYGCILQDVFLMYLNLAGFVLTLLQLTLFCIYPKKRANLHLLSDIQVIIPQHKIKITSTT